MKIALVSMLISLVTITPAFAKPLDCTFTSYDQLGHSQAGQDKIIISYLGEKFVLDPAKGAIQLGWKEGWTKPIKVQAEPKTKSFAAYTWIVKKSDSEGKILRRRYSYRIYNDGSTVAHMSIMGANYGTLRGTGTCK